MQTHATHAVRKAVQAQAAVLDSPPPTAAMLALLQDIRTALLGTDARALRRSVGLVGRLLGNDLQLQHDADRLRENARLLLRQARGVLRTSQAYLRHMGACLDALVEADQALQACLEQGSASPTAGASATDTHGLHHVQQVAMATGLSIAQVQLELANHERLHHTFARMVDTLPALLLHDALHARGQRQCELQRQAIDDLHTLETLIAADPSPELP